MKKKTYIITFEEINGESVMNRTNDGFTAVELLGVIELTRVEIIDQMRGVIQPDIIKRTVIKD